VLEFATSKYDVTFPMFSKIEVNGDGRHALYEQLVTTADAERHTGDIRWNFEKFLIASDGSVIARFSPMTDPGAPELAAAIEAALG